MMKLKSYPCLSAILLAILLILSLTIGSIGCTEKATAPEAEFTASPTSDTASLEVQFTDQSAGKITHWQWDFDNDGTVDSTQQSPSYTYDTPGIYTVLLEVTGPGGSDTETRVNYIEVYGSPVAGFNASPTSGTVPLEVQFTDQSTGKITHWQWDFDNDGTVDSTQQSPSYTYDTPGIYTVLLEVTGPGGSDTKSKVDYITVTTTTIYVPLLIPYTGPYATGYEIIDITAKALIEYINTEDPISGVTLELLAYDSESTSEQAIPGYQYLEGKGAKFIAVTDTEVMPTLKSTVDADKFPIFMPSGMTLATADPGYVFCIPMEFYHQTQSLMEYIMDEWDYTTTGRSPRIGLFGWPVEYGTDRQEAIEDYIEDNPGKFADDAAVIRLVAPTKTSFTNEVEALKDCDYIFAGATSLAMSPFIGLMRSSGYTDPVFCFLGSDTGFMSVYAATEASRNNIDGTLWASDGGYWKTDDAEIAEITRTLIDSYFEVDGLALVESGKIPTLATIVTSLLVPIDILREAVNLVEDPVDITGELIYQVAITMGFNYDGYQTLGFTETVRELLLYERIYQYSATTDDWLLVSDWIKAPAYE